MCSSFIYLFINYLPITGPVTGACGLGLTIHNEPNSILTSVGNKFGSLFASILNNSLKIAIRLLSFSFSRKCPAGEKCLEGKLYGYSMGACMKEQQCVFGQSHTLISKYIKRLDEPLLALRE